MIDLSNNQITKIQGLDNLASLEMLWLEYNKITKIEGLEKLTKLEILDIYKNKIPKSQYNKIDQLKIKNSKIKVYV